VHDQEADDIGQHVRVLASCQKEEEGRRRLLLLPVYGTDAARSETLPRR
jgi:hypothetical protein